MGDYKKIEYTHRLSAYEVKVPNWSGQAFTRTPYSAWSAGGQLAWYQAYNTTKHDRHSEFPQATFQHLIDACCGLLVILSAQFWTVDFSPRNSFLVLSGPSDGMESAIGGYFRVRFPQNMPANLRYEFDWQQLSQQADPFDQFDYTQVP
jgi:hypothetical protein